MFMYLLLQETTRAPNYEQNTIYSSCREKKILFVCLYQDGGGKSAIIQTRILKENTLMV